MRDNAEEFSIQLRGEGNGGKDGVFRKKADRGIRPLFQPLNGEFSIDCGNNDIAVAGGEAAIHHQNISIADSGSNHALTACADEVSGGRVADTQLIEVERAVQLSHGRTGKSGGYRFVEKGNSVRVVFCGLAHVAARMIPLPR